MTIQIGDGSANPVFTDVVQQSQALGSLNSQNLIQLRGQSTVTIQVTAIGTQTLIFEASTDGTNFTNVNVFPVAFGAPVLTTTTTGHWIIVVAGFYQFRVRCSAYTSGSATVSLVAAQGTNEQQVTTGISQGVTSSGQLMDIAGGAVTTANPSYTTGNANPLSLTTAGGLRVALLGNTGATLDAAPSATAPTNAVYVGVRAQNANPTAATNGQMVAIAADLAGRLITTPLNYRTLIGSTATTISATGATTIVAAGGANVFRDLCQIIITTAGAAAQTITISDGTLSWIIDYPNAAVAPGSPLVISFTDVPLTATTANTAWTANQSVATACHYLVQFVSRLA